MIKKMYIYTDINYNGIDHNIRTPEIVIEHVPINVDVDNQYLVYVQPNVQINTTAIVGTNHIVDVIV